MLSAELALQFRVSFSECKAYANESRESLFSMPSAAKARCLTNCKGSTILTNNQLIIDKKC